ncbi:MAG: Ribonuclease HII [Candidatus Jorgensenbacteria bacterium GW2011_GWA1_48_13]|uniref:Ribonuclease n=1 Tax=Candidatus Jorgensenbacteria bacterium GW2011_GWB1_50_10 TaxID=1618665 RepID=A0A0G1W8R7_9BACT|nr:MAG: Ribonuclease HII [Candidatus Jorgensenbacteria bacterium GW2011_GWA1_48_13]KKW15030.1 MAG: Ribonuclease HII [Candidatus Jorgensenbacteria bacterium GW2011_GWB1_50_10]
MARKRYIVGIDEVGRGSLAGYLLVAAVIVPSGINLRRRHLPKIKDSKRLTALARGKWLSFVERHPGIKYTLFKASPGTIDGINVTRAANIAATGAVRNLMTKNPATFARANVYLDGGLYLNLKNVKFRTLTRGDEKINAIKLASIIAKVKRDKYMTELHKKYPKYAFDKHKGYGTKKHKRAIKKYGPTKIHRLTFI